MKKAYLLSFPIIFVLTTSVLIWGHFQISQSIIVENISDNVVERVESTFCGKKLSIPTLFPHEKIKKSITANCDDAFSFTWCLKYGLCFTQNNLGYVTSADGSHSVFQITDGGLQFHQN